MSTTANVGIYYNSVSQKIQKSKANQSTSEGESLGRQFAPSLPPDSLLGSVLSVYLQRGLYASCRAAGPARWMSADLDKDMTKIRQQDSASKTISSTSSTLSIFRKVDGQNARRHLGRFLSSTSSTSFSKGGVMCGRVRARGRARSEPSPFRETGRRSRRECTTSTQSCDNLVYHAVFSEVDGGRQ